MNVTYKNDGKGKHQSWSAETSLNGFEDGSYSVELTAYGASKEEARLNFDKLAQATVLKICNAALEAHLEGPSLTSQHENTGGGA